MTYINDAFPSMIQMSIFVRTQRHGLKICPNPQGQGDCSWGVIGPTVINFEVCRCESLSTFFSKLPEFTASK